MGYKSLLYKFKTKLDRHRKPVPICSLPLELIELIASWLPPLDLGALRRTCKQLHVQTSTVYWKTTLQEITTDVSRASLDELEKIANNSYLRRYVRRMVFRGFDFDGEDMGKGYDWISHRHNGHLMQGHPAVQTLSSILGRLPNCNSLNITALISQNGGQPDLEHFRPTDCMTALLEVIPKARLRVTTFTIEYIQSFGPDPQRVHIPSEDQFEAVGQALEELNLIYAHNQGIVRHWTYNLLRHACRLKRLYVKNLLGMVYPDFLHRLALVDGPGPLPWSGLEEIRLKYVTAPLTDLLVLLERCRHSLRVLRTRKMGLRASLDDIREMLWTLGGFPQLETVCFDDPRLGTEMMAPYIRFAVENPVVDEVLDTRIEYRVDRPHGSKAYYAAYSGPRMDVALGILARNVDYVRRSNRVFRPTTTTTTTTA